MLAVLWKSNLRKPCPTASCLLNNRRPRRLLADRLGGHAWWCLALGGRPLCPGAHGLPRASGNAQTNILCHCTGSFEICYYTQCFALSKPASECAIFTQTHSNNQAQEIQREAFVLTSCSYQRRKMAFLRFVLIVLGLCWAMAGLSSHDSDACFLLFQYERARFKKEGGPPAACFVLSVFSGIPALRRPCHASVSW